MANHINFGDLLKDDGAIKAAIEQLEAFRKEIEETAKTVDTEAKKLKGSIESINPALKENNEDLAKMASEAEKLAAKKKELQKTVTGLTASIAELSEAQKEKTKIDQLEEKVLKTKENYYDNLKAKLELAREQYKQLTKEEQENEAIGGKLANSISELSKEYKELSSTIKNGKDTVKDVNVELTKNAEELVGVADNAKKTKVTIEDLRKSLKKYQNDSKQSGGFTSVATNTEGGDNINSFKGVGENKLIGLTELQKQYNKLLDEGEIDLKEYNESMDKLMILQADVSKGVEILTEKQLQYRQSVDKSGDLSEAFENANPRIKDLISTMAGLKTEQDELKNSQKELEKSYKEGEITTDQYAEKKALLTLREIELKNSSKETATELKLQIQLANSAEGSYNHLSAQYGLNKIEINKLTQAERENTEEGKKLIKTTEEIYKKMAQMQAETGKNQLSVGDYTNSIKKALGLNGQFGNSLMNLASGGKGMSGLFSTLSTGVASFGRALLALLANPVFLVIAGIAGIGMAFKFWYDYNAGLVKATALTKQFTDLSGNEMKALRNEVQAVADAYDKDFKETMIAVNSVAKQFGITHQEAIKVVRDGFVSGADAGGQFLSMLQRYPAQFKEAGFSASEFVAIATQTVNSGIFSDKGLAAIKMANSNIREMKKNTAAALDGIGLSSDAILKGLSDGSLKTMDVINQVSKQIKGLGPTSQEVGNVMAYVFGRQGKDAGVEFIKSLEDMTTELDVVKEKAGLLTQLADEQIEANLELQNVTSALFDMTGGGFESVTAQAKIYATKGLTAIVKGLIDIINWGIKLYNDSIAFRAIIQGIIAYYKIMWNTVKALFSYMIDTLSIIGDALYAAFTLDVDGLVASVKKWGRLVVDTALTTATETKDILKDAYKDTMEGEKIKPIEIPVSVVGASNAKDTLDGLGETDITGGGSGGGKDKKPKIDKTKINNAWQKELQNSETSLLKDGAAKEKKILEDKYAQEIAALEAKYDKEKSVIENAEEIKAQIIKNKAQKLQEEKDKIDSKYQLEELKRSEETLNLKLAATAANSDAENNLKVQLLENARKQELARNKQLTTEMRQSEADINAKYNKLILKQDRQFYVERELLMFDQMQDLNESEIALLEKSEAFKTRLRLNAEKERLKKILELNKDADEKLTGTQIKTIENQIKKIDQEIKTSSANERGQDLYGLLGISLSDEKKEAINTSTQFALDQITQVLEANVQAKQIAVDLANQEVESKKSNLEKEIEARNNGYAYNVAQAQRELDLAKRNQEKALKDQKKAQKEQQAIESLKQISSLVTASAMIWGQLGFPAAIPAIAIMWGSFAYAKIKAAQLAKQQTEAEQYGEGGYEFLNGGSHSSGNDIPLGNTNSGKRRTAEGGELLAIINKRNTRKYRSILPDVVDSLNKGVFESKYLNTFNAGEQIVAVDNGVSDLTRLEDGVEQIVKQGETKIVQSGNGVIRVNRGLIQFIKN